MPAHLIKTQWKIVTKKNLRFLTSFSPGLFSVHFICASFLS
uniref:Uncharacterized protein n=1 Tax=Anguilla anguilla TaxID=7936 RepID=A0A0E9RWP6_ANGAN